MSAAATIKPERLLIVANVHINGIEHRSPPVLLVPSAAALVDARKVLIAHPPMTGGQKAGIDEQTSEAAAGRGRARRELG